jgi:16S rRNA (guanine527-N7)-methyltransferase
MPEERSDTTRSAASSSLSETLSRYAVDVPPEQAARLDQYCHALWDWNTKLNLTRHTDYEKFVCRDLWDSLQLARLLDAGEHVLDVGSGGGVPGVVLAILRPDLRIALCESVGKKAAALGAIVKSLRLPLSVLHGRAEQLLAEVPDHTLIARAVGPLWRILKWFQPHWSLIRRMLVIKGPRWVDERSEARHRGLLRGLELRRAAVYASPDTNAENVILHIWRKASS